MKRMPAVYRFLVISVLLFITATTGNAQTRTTVLQYDTGFRLINSPYSRVFKKGDDIWITIRPDSFSRIYRSSMLDTLRARGNAMKANLIDSGWIAVYKQIWGGKADSIKSQLTKWLAYLQDTTSSTTGISFFPLLPATNDLAQQSYLAYPQKGDSVPINTTLSLTDDNCPWVVDEFTTETRFKIVFKDYIRDALIKEYNTDRPDNFKTWKPQNFAEWKRQGAALLKSLKDSLFCLSESPKTIAFCLREGFDPQFRRWINMLTGGDSLFFMEWLWYTDGILSFNPLGFTADKNFTSGISAKDSLNLWKDSIYEQKLREAIKNCPICKVNPDTLAKWLKQMGNGKTLFPFADSLAASQDNSRRREAFLKTGVDLYDFVYPYARKHDSDGYIYQFDALKRYKRVDKWIDGYEKYLGDIPLHKLKKTYLNLPDDKKAFIAVHNLSPDIKLKFSEVQSDAKDENGFLIAADTVAGTLLSLSSLLTTGGLVTTISSGVAPATQRPANTIAASNMKDTSLPAVKGDGVNVAVTILDKRFVFEVSPSQGVDECVSKLADVFTYVAQKEGFSCFGHQLAQFIKDNGATGTLGIFCKTKDTSSLQKNLSNSVQLWVDYLNLEVVNTIKLLEMDSLLIENAQRILMPLDRLYAIVTADKDNGLLRTQLIYPSKVQSLKTDTYSLTWSTTKDSTQKKAAGGKFTQAPRHVFTLGFGAGPTINLVPLNSVTTNSSGNLVISKENEVVAFMAGVHIYPWKLFNLDNRFFLHRGYGTSSWSRLSLFLGVAIPDPAKNYYTGLSLDLIPGLKLHAGAHWLWYTKYNIVNNQVADQASAVKYGGVYAGLNIDPTAAITKLFTTKKN